MSQLYCDQCGYRSREFYAGHYNLVFSCLRCRNISVSEMRPFVYDPPDCESCQKPLLREEYLRVKSMRPEEDIRKCPRCLKESLRLTIDPIHFQFGPDGQIPESGQLLHGTSHQPSRELINKFWVRVPRLSIHLWPTIVNRDSRTIPDGFHEFRTVKVDGEKLFVEYVRELEDHEWQWLC
jgi:hypothetical protein